jgi:hypothetical protein
VHELLFISVGSGGDIGLHFHIHSFGRIWFCGKLMLSYTLTNINISLYYITSHPILSLELDIVDLTL